MRKGDIIDSMDRGKIKRAILVLTAFFGLGGVFLTNGGVVQAISCDAEDAEFWSDGVIINAISTEFGANTWVFKRSTCYDTWPNSSTITVECEGGSDGYGGVTKGTKTLDICVANEGESGTTADPYNQRPGSANQGGSGATGTTIVGTDLGTGAPDNMGTVTTPGVDGSSELANYYCLNNDTNVCSGIFNSTREAAEAKCVSPDTLYENKDECEDREDAVDAAIAGEIYDIGGVTGNDTPLDFAGELLLNNEEGTAVQDVFGTVSSIVDLIVRYLFIAGGILFFVLILISGYRLIFLGDKQKAVSSVRTNLTIGVVGLMIMFGAFWILEIIETLTGVPLGGIFG